MSAPVFVRRPVSGCIVAFATVPGILTGLGLTLVLVRGEAPLPARVALGALGVAMIAACLAILLGSSGVLIERAHRTITPLYRWPGIRIRGTTVQVAPSDGLVIDTRIAGATAAYPRIANSGVYLRGPSGTRFVMGTRSRAEAARVAREIAALLDLTVR